MDILVSEVGPRDGLQSVKRIMPTASKHRWIAALAQAGLRASVALAPAPRPWARGAGTRAEGPASCQRGLGHDRIGGIVDTFQVWEELKLVV